MRHQNRGSSRASVDSKLVKLAGDYPESICGKPVKEDFRSCEEHQRPFGFLSNEESEQLQDDRRKLHEDEYTDVEEESEDDDDEETLAEPSDAE